MGFYSNHNFVHTFLKSKVKETRKSIIAVLCFYNTSRDKNSHKDCNEFRYWLIRSLRYIPENHGLYPLDHNEIIKEPKLIRNEPLTDTDAIQIGRKFRSDYVVFGEISPLRDILITVHILKIDIEKRVLDFEIRRRITNIPSLAQKTTEEILYNLKEIRDSEKRLAKDRLSSIKTTIKAGKYFSEGLDNFFRHNFDKSISALEKAIKEDKNFANPHYLLAFIYFYQNKDQLVIEELVKTINIEPKWADPHYFLGVVYKRKGRYLEAKIYYEKALELENRSDYKMIYKTALAGIFFKLNRVEEAKKIIREIEETKTTHIKVLYNLAARYCELGDLEKALSLLKEAKNKGLSEYDCKAALADPDFNNFRRNLTKYKEFEELLRQCK